MLPAAHTDKKLMQPQQLQKSEREKPHCGGTNQHALTQTPKHQSRVRTKETKVQTGWLAVCMAMDLTTKVW